MIKRINGHRYYVEITIVMLIIFGSLFWLMVHQNQIVNGLDSPDKQIQTHTFERLLAKNNLNDRLPVLFDLKKIVGDIEIFKSNDQAGHSYWLVKVLARLYIDTDCGFSFIFNEKDLCLLCTPDRIEIGNGGIYDINKDGKLEKIVQFALNPYLPGEWLKNKQNYMCTFQIWQIEFEKSELLIEVQYEDIDKMITNNEIITLEHAFSRHMQPTEFVLAGKSEIARIYWDTSSNCFSVKGDNSDQWKQIFPRKE